MWSPLSISRTRLCQCDHTKPGRYFFSNPANRQINGTNHRTSRSRGNKQPNKILSITCKCGFMLYTVGTDCLIRFHTAQHKHITLLLLSLSHFPPCVLSLYHLITLNELIVIKQPNTLTFCIVGLLKSQQCTQIPSTRWAAFVRDLVPSNIECIHHK